MLTERRKADRAKMAAQLVMLVTDAGGTATIRDCATHIWSDGSRPLPEDRHRLIVSIAAPGGAIVTVDFDKNSCQPDVHVFTWNIDLDSDSRFSDAMGSVNPYHHSKASRVAHGFDELCYQIGYDLSLLISGNGYSEERKAAAIAKNGCTAAEQNAQWAIWREEFAAECAARKVAA